ncbi:hypothetical protein Cni_G22492 [Canna indica]|uniref:EF-hand domain-containing protein n=1 Tax=Canna indica TaxID=4628 RepID=A0AAQ3KSK0_9LILI|nr:hypothetical protein Cni_G22492 [Canna indica]
MGMIRSLFSRHRSKPPHPAGTASPPSLAAAASSLGDLQRVFNKFDSNGDGKISAEELADVLESLGQRPSDEELLRMMSEVDTDGDGFISFDEFVELNTTQAEPEEDLRLAFAVFDLDRSGSISADEIARVLRGIGEGASIAKCRRMIEGVDRDGDGLVSFEEFKAMMTAGGGNAFAALAKVAAD